MRIIPKLGAPLQSSSTITLSWNAVSGASGYYVNRYLSAGAATDDYVEYKSTSSTSYTWSGLSSDTTYYFRVSAYNSSGENYSSMVSATTLPGSGTQSSPISLSNGYWVDGSITSSASAQ